MTDKDVLSNEEKDALQDTVADDSAELSEELSEGSSGEPQVHGAFDFASREHFALAQMKGLSVANEKFCMNLQAGLNQAFGIPIEVSMQSPEILKTDECMASIKENAVLNVMKVNLASGQGLLIMNGELLSEFINRYFGSQLSQSSISKSGRSLSTTETRINERVIQLFASSLKIGWKDIATIEMAKVITETNPEFIKFGEKEEMVVRFTVDISFADEFTGSVEWLLPYASIEPLSSRSDEESTSLSDAQKVSAWLGRLQEGVQDVQLDVQARMSGFEMSIREVRAFQVGTVLPLSNPGDVYLCIEDIPFFTGEYGAHADKKAVSLKRKIELAS